VSPIECRWACEAVTLDLQRGAFYVGIVTGVVIASLVWSCSLLLRSRKS